MFEPHGDATSEAVSRRRVLAAAGTATVPLVAGCSGIGGGGTDEEDDEDDDESTPTGDEGSTPAGDDETTDAMGGEETPTDSPTPTGTPTVDAEGQGNSVVDGLEVVDTRPLSDYYREENIFAVEVTVENTGGQTTDAMEYNYVITAYDADGNDITQSGYGTSATEDTEMEPGGSASPVANTEVDGTFDDVASYEVSVQCEGYVRAEGVYCQ